MYTLYVRGQLKRPNQRTYFNLNSQKTHILSLHNNNYSIGLHENLFWKSTPTLANTLKSVFIFYK